MPPIGAGNLEVCSRGTWSLILAYGNRISLIRQKPRNQSRQDNLEDLAVKLYAISNHRTHLTELTPLPKAPWKELTRILGSVTSGDWQVENGGESVPLFMPQ